MKETTPRRIEYVSILYINFFPALEVNKAGKVETKGDKSFLHVQ